MMQPKKKFLYYSYLIILLSLSWSCKTSQPLIVNSDRDIPIEPLLMEIDKFGNIYVVDVNQRLIKYNAEGVYVNEYKDRRGGQIAFIDVSNPLKVLVYFKQTGVIRFLDTTMSEIEWVSFDNSPQFLLSDAVCLTNDDKIWIADNTNSKIIKVDRSMNTVAETNRFVDLGIENFNIRKMREADNKLVVMTKNSGFVIFDNFGQYLQRISAPLSRDFQFDGRSILYDTPTNYRFQNLRMSDFSFVSLPIGVNRDGLLLARKNKEVWVLAYSDGIDILQLNKIETEK